MRTLTNQTTKIKLDFPRTWKPENLTGLTIRIKDVAGNDLLPDPYIDDVDFYAATVLDADARRYARSIVLDSEAAALTIGDMIRIEGIQGYEDHTVKGYDATNLTAVLDEYLDRDFEAGAAVNRLYGVYTADLSDADVFSPGIQMLITWTPTGTGDIITDLAEIESSLQLDVAAFTKEFKALYSRAYDALTTPADRLDTVIVLAQDELRTDLIDRNLDPTRLKDQRLISPPLMAMVAVMWARDGDEDTSDELERYEKAYSAAFEKLCRSPVWVDLDGDGTQDTGEIESHPAQFGKDW